MLDGFLTALVIGPNPLPPSIWLHKVWDKKDMVWETTAQAEQIISMIMRHMNFLAAQFKDDPESFEPMISINTFEGEEIRVIDEWCVGFVEGMMLDAAGWKPLLDSENYEVMLLPLMLYGTDAGWDQLKQNPELGKRHDRFVDALPGCIINIHEFWLPNRKAAVTSGTVRHTEPRPGRNDLCSCGSGKKFKKCCGNPTKIH